MKTYIGDSLFSVSIFRCFNILMFQIAQGYFNLLKLEGRLDNIKTFSFYLTENTQRLHYK
jgi:hypothetical protein